MERTFFSVPGDGRRHVRTAKGSYLIPACTPAFTLCRAHTLMLANTSAVRLLVLPYQGSGTANPTHDRGGRIMQICR